MCNEMCKEFNCFNYSIRLKRNKIAGFWEDLCPNLEDDEFRHFFRMHKETLRSLTSFLKPERRNYQGGREPVGPAKMVVVTVCFLGAQSPGKQLSNLFGMTESCFVNVIEYILDLLTHKSQLVIKWPSKDEYLTIANEFNKRKIR